MTSHQSLADYAKKSEIPTSLPANGGNADTVDGIHANGLLTALSNSDNGISITVGGTTKSVSNIRVNYASSAGSASKVYGKVGYTGSHVLVRCDMNSDQFRIIAGSSGSNKGWAEIATADDGDEPIYVRQYTGVFSSVARTLTLLDGGGNTTFPGSVTARKFHSNASASTDLTVIPPDTAIALETGNGNGSVNSWIWRENYKLSNWGIFHNKSEDNSINFVGNNTIRVKISLASNSLKVGGTEVSLEGHTHPYLPLSGGTMTGVITGNTGNGLIIQSANTGVWKEGLRIYPASNNYSVLSLQSSDSKNVFAMVTNVSSHTAYFDYCKDGSLVSIHMPYKSGTIALTTDNVESATKLQTPRSIWGQSFDGTNDIKGPLYLSGYLFMKFGGEWLSTIDNDGNGPIFGYELAVRNRCAYYTGSPVYICGGSYINHASGITVNSSNNVGIGTTTPAYKLHVAGDIYSSGNILSAGGITAYSSSDVRLKTNITKLNCLKVIKSIGGTYEFDYICDHKHSIGFIAQNVNNPLLKDIVAKDDNGYLKINYWNPKLISLAFGALTEIDDEVDKLKARVRELENEVEYLKNKDYVLQ